ncbi:Riboflavin biosynthesis protein RibF [bioreactor metagenome]|uniref:Bifunctional riboflavin kinase/FMN adenylyltransferase n=1 Tax=bioreactor metagenome TaxID=1076179 RepID=A0A644VTE8_9ZZZZ
MFGDMTNMVKKKYAATVGFFDGVHTGHRFLIAELKKESAKRGLKSMVITFKVHPRKVLHAAYLPQLLTSAEEKLEQLKSTDVDEVVELDFTTEMAQLTAAEFIKQILAEQLGVKLLLVGHDHRFGKNREEGFPEYVAYGKQNGMEVIQATRYSTEQFSHISSSEVRNALLNGEIERANTLLTYPYAFTGYVVSGFQVGKKIGFPTANLNPVEPDKLIPAIGVYAVLIDWNGTTYSGMMNIGRRPTLDNGDAVSLEVHIINFDADIYHQQVKVTFIRKIRDEKKFNSVEELIEQLKSDKEVVMGANS